MSKVKNVFVLLILVIVLAIGVAGCNSGTDELQSKIDGLQSQLEELNDRLLKMEEENKKLTDQIDVLEKELAKQSQGSFYSLQEAYDNGWLTQADLMSIAYYRNGGREFNEEIMSEDYVPSPKTPEVLSRLTQLKIKNAAAKNYREQYDKTDVKAEDFIITEYYGTYGACVAVIVDRLDVNYPDIYAPITIGIGGVSFNYAYSHPAIVVWKENDYATKEELAELIDKLAYTQQRIEQLKNELKNLCNKSPAIDEELEKTIRQDYLEQYDYEFRYDCFYGNYGDCYVFFAAGDAGVVKKVTIAGQVFEYMTDWKICVWKDGQFATLEEAYAANWLTDEDIANIAVTHNEFVELQKKFNKI